MSHLEDRLADFVFEDLPSAEMERTRRHVAQCLECQKNVQSFRKTLGLLESLPSEDVPRRMVFVPQSPKPGGTSSSAWARLAWAFPGSVAAVLLLAVLVTGGLRIDWSDGLEVALGGTPEESADGVAGTEPILAEVDYDQLDYDRIAMLVDASRASDLAAALGETRAELARIGRNLDTLDESSALEIQRLRAEIRRLYDQNQLVQRDLYDQNAAFQMIASRLE